MWIADAVRRLPGYDRKTPDEDCRFWWELGSCFEWKLRGWSYSRYLLPGGWNKGLKPEAYVLVGPHSKFWPAMAKPSPHVMFPLSSIPIFLIDVAKPALIDAKIFEIFSFGFYNTRASRFQTWTKQLANWISLPSSFVSWVPNHPLHEVMSRASFHMFISVTF